MSQQHWIIPQQKIFCIGLNKTGTTSIGDALSRLGYNRSGWDPNHSGNLTMRWHENKITPLLHKKLMSADAFEDLPWPLYYEFLDTICPNAKFILTVRESPEMWLESMRKHIARQLRTSSIEGDRGWVGHFLIYGSYNPQADADKYLKVYNEHNAGIRARFAGRPGKLLEMCFENRDGWEVLCDFLNVPVPDAPFPHSNAAKRDEVAA